MNRSSFLVLVFAVTSAFFFLLLIFLRIPFSPYPLMSWQDVLDLLTPLALIPLYWTLFLTTERPSASGNETYAFMALAALWVLGHGMHLSANSVNNLSEALADSGGLNILKSDIYRLTYFYDEYLSHAVWHAGVLGLAALLMMRAWQRHDSDRLAWWPVSAAGLIYGFTLFAIVLEGQTTLVGFPFLVVVSLLALFKGRDRLSQQTVFAFFTLSFCVAVVLFSGWGLYWMGFPQFTDVGLF